MSEDFAATKRVLEDAVTVGQAEVKKARVEAPSAVLHCRNVPLDCTEIELMQLGQPFGRVVNVLMLNGKTQAFVQLESAEAATQMLTCYTATAPYIRKRPIYFSYSQHQQLTNPSLNLDGVSTGTILLVKIHNQLYPVTLDVLGQVFSKFGTILKVVTFTKQDGLFQCLVQYSDANSANQAKTMLDGQNLYARCCTLKIEHSKLTTLTVKYNNEKSWDFTNPNLPSGEGAGGMGQPMGMPAMGMMGQIGVIGNAPMGMTGANMMQAAPAPSVLLVNGLPITNELTCDMLFMLFGVYADVDRVKILFNKQDSALIQVHDGTQAQCALTHLNGIKLFGSEINVMISKHSDVAMPKKDTVKVEDGTRELTKDYSTSPLHRFRKVGSNNFKNITAPNSTLHVSNIPASVDEALLTQLFAPYGTVTGVRFFTAKAQENAPPSTTDRRMALVRFGTMDESIMALIKVHNYPIADKTHLRISFSKAEF